MTDRNVRDKCEAFEWLAEKLKGHRVELRTDHIAGTVLVSAMPEGPECEAREYCGVNLLDAVRLAAGHGD